MKHILMQLTAYDCGQEYEIDDYSILLETAEGGGGDDNEVGEEHKKNEHSNYLFGLNSILGIFLGSVYCLG